MNISNKCMTAKSFVINIENDELKDLKKMKSDGYHEYHYSEDKRELDTGIR